MNECKNLDEIKIYPVLEIFRGIKYDEILKSFIFDTNSNLGKDIFNQKKNYIRTLTNIIASWMFSLYSIYDFKFDNFFPNNCSNNTNLKNTLINFTKFNKNLTNNNQVVDKIISNLNKSYNEALKKLDEYKKSDSFNSSKYFYNLEKTEINQNRYGQNKRFYKFKIFTEIKTFSNRLKNILNNILIPVDIYDRLKDKYSGKQEFFDILIWTMTYRYQILGSNNNQLGVLPENLLKLKEDFGVNFELFGSSINFTLDNYCSLYFDVEKYFGSSGNFFNFDIKSGVYSFNPPYQNDIIEKGISKLLNVLEDDKNLYTFIITIPIWDNIGKKIMKFKYPEKKLVQEIDYEDFSIVKKILGSKFFKIKLMISKNNFTYLDHNFHLFKNSTIQNTYVIILSNDSSTDFSKINEYNFKDYE